MTHQLSGKIGGNLISKDIEYTINTLKNIDSIYSDNVKYIENVETPDSETAIITLSQNINFFEYYLDFPIVSSSYYYNEDFVNSTKIPVGTGMYKIASIDDSNILLVINDRWRKLESDMPKTQSITIHRYNAIGEIFNAFKLGNIDILNTQMTNYSDYIGTMGYNKKEYPGRKYNFISFNCNDSILSDKEVRQAIYKGINKGNLVSTVFNNTKMVSSSPLGYGSYLNYEDNILEYSQDDAKRILQDDGWVFTNNRWQKTIDGYVRKLTLSLVVNESDQERVNASYNIKEQLESIGIMINVVKVSPERYYQYIGEKNYQMLMTGITNSTNPDLSFLYGKDNLANYYNEDIFAKINNLDNYSEIQKQINDDVPYIGLYRDKNTLILNANVGGNFIPTAYFTYYSFNKWYRQQ